MSSFISDILVVSCNMQTNAQVTKYMNALKTASLVVMDANLRLDTMKFLLKTCSDNDVDGEYNLFFLPFYIMFLFLFYIQTKDLSC